LFAFQQHLVRFAKIAALLSAAWTMLCAVLVVGPQVSAWLQDGVLDAYSLSSTISRLHGNQKYFTAGSDNLRSNWIVDWLLEVPAVVPLLTASALLLAFYAWVATVEKEISTERSRG